MMTSRNETPFNFGLLPGGRYQHSTRTDTTREYKIQVPVAIDSTWCWFYGASLMVFLTFRDNRKRQALVRLHLWVQQRIILD